MNFESSGTRIFEYGFELDSKSNYLGQSYDLFSKREIGFVPGVYRLEMLAESTRDFSSFLPYRFHHWDLEGFFARAFFARFSETAIFPVKQQHSNSQKLYKYFYRNVKCHLCV